MRYNLANMVRNRKPGTTALMPVIEQSAGVERSYLAQLRRIEHEAARGIREVIIPAYERRQAQLRDGLTRDADEASMDALRLLVGAMVRAVTAQVTQLLKLEGLRHTKAWMSTARRTFGIDLTSVVREDDLADFLEVAALRNASLIRGLSDDLLKRVAHETTTALLAGEAVKDLQARLKRQLAISDSRARLIARDQTSKLTSDLNRKRHEEAGVNSYVWRTSQDERVRERHRALEGKVYKYGEPTGAEEGLPPGQPIQCRCIAQGRVEF
jgi:SPP1 gp7 family putative phage head morphogenesis protein